MGRVKCCTNIACSEYRKTYFKEKDSFCPKCGEELVVVCKMPGCYKPMPQDSREKYCAIHAAEMKDKREKTGKAALAIGGGILGVAAIAVSALKIFKRRDC